MRITDVTRNDITGGYFENTLLTSSESNERLVTKVRDTKDNCVSECERCDVKNNCDSKATDRAHMVAS